VLQIREMRVPVKVCIRAVRRGEVFDQKWKGVMERGRWL
jgi:hypothetical protein